MKPKSSIITGCTSSTSSDCIKWNGPDIPCIGLTTGMSVTDVEHMLACKVCDIADGLDLSDLDLTCLVAQPDVDPDDKSVKLILQLLLENQCTLKELIDAANGGGDDSCCDLTLNMKCLKKFDAFDNEIPQNLNQTLQSIINQVCTNKDDIAIIKNDVSDLQDQIDNLPEPTEPYEEPLVTTCVAVAKPLSQAFTLLGADYCTYKTAVGTPLQIQAAMAQQCENLSQELGSEIGWNLAPQNLAQTVSNMWITICDLRDRIKAIEQTCCAPTCDKVKIGFAAEFDTDNGEVTLTFSSGAGTVIPTGFIDCGTVLTITDKNGLTVTHSNLDITQNGIVGPLSLGSLAAGTLIFSFKTMFCLKDNLDTIILRCQDCVTEEVVYDGTGCCHIKNTTATDVILIYSSPIT